MFNPPHPGETLLEDVLPELNITIGDFAKHLGYSREHVSRILHGHSPITADLAVRLERAGIGRAKIWLAVQADYDVWQVQQQSHTPIKKLAANA